MSTITVIKNPGDGYEMTLTITGTMNPFHPAEAVVRELLDLAAQAAFPLLRGDFDERVVDVLEHKFRARAIRESKGLTFDELRDLPKGAVVLDRDGDAWERQDDGVWEWTNPDDHLDVATLSSEALHHNWAPLRHRPAEPAHQPAPEPEPGD